MTVAPPDTTSDIDRMMIADDPHDAALIENCHPPRWTNPTPAGKYNLVVLGSGTAGLVSAMGAAGLGARVAIVERALTGGDCLNVGCVPSKGVIRAGRAAYDARESEEFGVRLSGAPAVDFGAAMERMRRLRSRISANDSVHRLKSAGVDVFLGHASFAGPDAVEVDGARLVFDRAVIATGGRAIELPIPGLAAAGYLTNETVFTLTSLPRRLAVIGAGPIGCELAQAFGRLGSLVTLVNDVDEIMPREDADAARIVRRQFEREGITIACGAKIERVERRGDERVLFLNRSGTASEVRCDAILVAVGRAPNIEGLGLEAAGVTASVHGVDVDDRLRTSNRRIYAAGDVCSRFKFTHAADAMARNVLANAFFFGRRRTSGLVIPWCTFTDPEVAHVGAYEKDARDAGHEVETLTHEFADNDRAILDGEEKGFARIHFDRKTSRILGGTIVARHAGEMIGQVTMAIATRQKVGVLSSIVAPYPTQAEALKRIGDAAMRRSLTPLVKRIFSAWFRWRR